MKMALLLMLMTGLAALAVQVATAGDAADARTQESRAKAKQFLDRYLADLARMNRESQLASWAASCSGKAEDYAKAEQTELAMRKYHSDPEAYRLVCELLRERESFDPITYRALCVAKLAFEANQLPADLLKEMVARSSEIERLLNTYRATIDGRQYTDNELLELLAQENDGAKRRQYWEALKQVGAVVSPKLIELAKLRNQAARRLGYANYWDMQVRLQEYSPQQLLTLFGELEERTNKPFQQMKASMDAELARRFGIAPEQLMPWHYDNPFFQAAPPSEKIDLDEFYRDKTKEDLVEIARRYYEQIGLPIEPILERSSLYEQPGKGQHAFCCCIDRHGDVRLFCNMKPTADWMDTILHEAGHGVYDYYMDFTLPYNLRDPAHIFTTEGLAMYLGALAKTPEWIVRHAGADPARVREAAGAIREQRRREQLIFARWALVMLHFEKALYENPDRDLGALWWDTVERYQSLVRPPSRNEPDWAAKPHFTVAPVYYHNYLLGELFAAQLRHAMREKIGGDGPYYEQPELGALLKQAVFMPGARWPWPEFVRRATGQELTAKFFAEEVAE